MYFLCTSVFGWCCLLLARRRWQRCKVARVVFVCLSVCLTVGCAADDGLVWWCSCLYVWRTRAGVRLCTVYTCTSAHRTVPKATASGKIHTRDRMPLIRRARYNREPGRRRRRCRHQHATCCTLHTRSRQIVCANRVATTTIHVLCEHERAVAMTAYSRCTTTQHARTLHRNTEI